MSVCGGVGRARLPSWKAASSIPASVHKCPKLLQKSPSLRVGLCNPPHSGIRHPIPHLRVNSLPFPLSPLHQHLSLFVPSNMFLVEIELHHVLPFPLSSPSWLLSCPSLKLVASLTLLLLYTYYDVCIYTNIDR